MVTTRIERDAYYSPTKLIDLFLENHIPEFIKPSCTVLEPCAGEGAIVNSLEAHNFRVHQSDIVQGSQFDATRIDYWLHKSPEWTFTNPPFNAAIPIIEHALNHSKSAVTMLLRASFLEPCKNRRHLLDNRITHICYVNPRPRFRSDSSGSDSATVAFITWSTDRFRIGSQKISYLVDWQLPNS